jgi:hypothetical protein
MLTICQVKKEVGVASLLDSCAVALLATDSSTAPKAPARRFRVTFALVSLGRAFSSFL